MDFRYVIVDKVLLNLALNLLLYEFLQGSSLQQPDYYGI